MARISERCDLAPIHSGLRWNIGPSGPSRSHDQATTVEADFTQTGPGGGAGHLRRQAWLRRKQRSSWSCCRLAILFVGPAHDDPERIVRHWPLQRLGFVPRRAHPQIALLVLVVWITGMAFGWIGSTTAFGDVVRNP